MGSPQATDLGPLLFPIFTNNELRQIFSVKIQENEINNATFHIKIKLVRQSYKLFNILIRGARHLQDKQFTPVR